MFRICQVKAARASLSLPSFESEIDACQLFFFLFPTPSPISFRQIIHIPHPTISDMQAEVGKGVCGKPQDWRRKGEVCLPLRISHIQSEVPRDSSSSSSSRAVVEEEEEEKQEQVVVGREEIFLLSPPPFPAFYLPFPFTAFVLPPA